MAGERFQRNRYVYRLRHVADELKAWEQHYAVAATTQESPERAQWVAERGQLLRQIRESLDDVSWRLQMLPQH